MQEEHDGLVALWRDASRIVGNEQARSNAGSEATAEIKALASALKLTESKFETDVQLQWQATRESCPATKPQSLGAKHVP